MTSWGLGRLRSHQVVPRDDSDVLVASPGGTLTHLAGSTIELCILDEADLPLPAFAPLPVVLP